MIRSLLLLVLLSQNLLQAKDDQPQIKAPPPKIVLESAKKHQIDSHHISVQIKEIGQSKDALSFQADRKTLPASLMKIPSCLFALETLGADFRFETRLIARGRVRDGILQGDLFLVGGLEPIFSATKLFDMALALRTKGIQKVEGNFFLVDSLFPSTPSIAELGALDQTYNPGMSALSVEFNRFRLINNAPPRRETDWRSLPPLDYLKVRESKVPMAPRQRFRAIEDNDHELWEYRKGHRYNQSEELPIKDPTRYVGELFHFFAKEIGVTLPSPQRGSYSGQRNDQVIHNYKGQELVQLCESSLEYSNNLVAEKILVKAALKVNPKVQSLEQASNELKIWLTRTYPDAGFDRTTIINGSGLSLETKIPPQALVRLLELSLERTYGGRSLMSILSLSGQSGWVRNRFHSEQLGYRLFLKTGSLDFVSNIAGYLIHSGKIYALSVFIADVQSRLELESTTDLNRSRQLGQEATSFRNRTHALAEDLLESFIKTL